MAPQPAPQPEPSFEPDSRAIEKAERIAEKMVTQLFSRTLQLTEVDSENVYIQDVVANLQILHDQIDLIRNLYPGIKHPSIDLYGTDIPIDFLQNVQDFEGNQLTYSDIINNQQLADKVYDELLSYQNANRPEYSTVEIENIKENVMFFLRIFLAFRGGFKPELFSRKINSGPPPGANGANTNFLTVRLKTINNGLLVKYSPAYFISWQYFGHPSTPITGYLTPGTYIFGGNGPSQPFVFDGSTLVNIPPDLNISLNAF